jgi:tetratricopeptide (TPR) repeat protein
VADRALAMAERLDRPALVADLLVTRGTALSSSGRRLEGLGAIEAGCRLAQSEGLLGVEGRALLNVSGPLSERDPQAMLVASRRALELGRQIGDRQGVSMAANNLAESARFTGDWDEAIAELRREAEASSGDELHWIRLALVAMLANRGEETHEVVAPLLEYVRVQAATGEPAWQQQEDAILGSLDLAAGRYGDAARRLRNAAETDPFNAALGFAEVAYAALLDRDAATAAAAVDGMRSTGSHGAIVKLAMRQTAAGMAALEGRVDEAVAGFEVVLDTFRAMDLPFPLATTGLMMAALLDGSIPQVAAATDEARAIFEQLRARAWLDRLEEAAAEGARGAAAVDTAAERVASAR